MSVPRSDARARRILFEGILNSLAATDDLTEADLQDEERMEALVFEALDTLHIGLDYREDLLSQASSAWRSQNYEFGHLFYATFFEHSINFLIVNQIARKLPQSSKVELIRSLAMPAKFGWLLELCGMRPFNQKHRAQILQVSERRNAFIHFKFPTVPIAAPESKKSVEERKAEHQQILAAVRYTKAYCTKHTAKGFATKVKRAVARSREA